MRNHCSYCQVKALAITYFVYPHIYMELVKYFWEFFDDIFFDMILLQLTAVSWILSHPTWFALKGCPICDGNVSMGIFKTNY